MGGETRGSSHGSQDNLPHTRARARHWAVTAGALAVLVGSVVFAEPAEVSASQPPDSSPPAAASHRAGSTPGPDPSDAPYPLDCAGAPVAVAKHVSADLDGDGRQDTAAAVHCLAGSGTPPHALYVLSYGPEPDAPARIVAALVDAKEGVNVTSLDVRGGKLTARVAGYSSPDVPRCCPDVSETRAWRWNSGRFVAVPGAPVSTV